MATQLAMNFPRFEPTVALHDYDAVMINSSGGKDSQTALHFVVKKAQVEKYPLDKITVVHADLGRMEWPGTKALVKQQADHYGLECVIVKRRTAAGHEETLLDYVKRRGMWPDNQNRYCTGDFKRGPGLRAITSLGHRWRKGGHNGKFRLLHVFGFRAEESPARKKKAVLSKNKRASNTIQTVTDWLPIFRLTLDEVWESIRASGVPYHYAYDLGMPRLSCILCIFAPFDALVIGGRANPGILSEYVQTEQETGHTFRKELPIADIQAAIASGYMPKVGRDLGAWNM